MLKIEGFTNICFIESCVSHFCELLQISIPKLLIFVDETISISGACYENEPGDYMIVIKAQEDGHMISTLAHELVHVKQFIVDGLAEKFDSTIPYVERWWEQEANEKEKLLIKSLIEQITTGKLLLP